MAARTPKVVPTLETTFIKFKSHGETFRLGLVSEFDQKMADSLRKENAGEGKVYATIAEELAAALADVAMGQVRLNNVVRRLANLCLGATEQIRSNGLSLTIEVAKVLKAKSTESRVASSTNRAVIKALSNLGINVKCSRTGDWTASSCDHRTLKDATGRTTNFGRGGIDRFYPKDTPLNVNNEEYDNRINTIEQEYIERINSALKKAEGAEAPVAEGAEAPVAEGAEGAEAPLAEGPTPDGEPEIVVPRYYNPKFNKLSNGIKSILKQLDKEITGTCESEIKAKRIEKDAILRYKAELETLMNKIKEEIETATQANTVTK